MIEAGTRIELLGGLRISVAGRRREGDIRGRQGRLLLAYLVLERHRPVTRDELVEALWAEDGTPPSATALAPVLSRLRRVLEPATIEGRELLELTLPEPVVVDAETMADRVVEARSALAAGDAALALSAAREAADAAGAGLLPGLDAPWLAAPRAACADQRAEALELAGRAGLALGPRALAAAERDARAAVAAAPFRESARSALIEVLRAQGNIAEAVLAYDEIRRLLGEELGTAPGPELVALHETLLHAGDAPAAAVPARLRSRAPRGVLVERDRELISLDETLSAAAAGRGRVLLLEGPAGVGKTTLLRELRDRAVAAGFTARTARAGVLERGYAFGVARQLFQEEAGEPGDGDASFATLATLHRRVEELAAVGPVLLAIDDLQWSDIGSLRFVVYLARRLGGLGVLVAATIRTGELDADDALLLELAQEPDAVVLEPRALSSSGTSDVVRERLGAAADPAFTAACHEVTGGNPLLVDQLVSALAAEAVAPDAAHAPQVRAVGPRAVSRTVLLRLRRLPEAATAVARAVATLGRAAELRAIAALAEVDEAATTAAVTALIRADVLRDGVPVEFAHPLVRDAIYTEHPAPARSLEHLRAAGILAALEADPEAVAAQLALAPARADRWVVERLRTAAAVAQRRGAPDSALAYLKRAQAEPPAADVQPELALELGVVAALVSGPEGVEPLREAHANLPEGPARSRAALQLSQLLLFVGSPDDGVSLAVQQLEQLGDAHGDLRDALHGVVLMGIAFGASVPLPATAPPAPDQSSVRRGPGARMFAAATAFLRAVSCGPAAEAAALGRAALEGDELFDADVGLFGPPATIAVLLEDPASGIGVFDRMAAHGRRTGKLLQAIAAELWGGFAALLAGDLDDALSRLGRAEEGLRLYGNPGGVVHALQALTLIEQGEVGRARQVMSQANDPVGASEEARYTLIALTELALAEGRSADAVLLTERLEPLRPPGMHPVYAPWRGLRARALAGRGERPPAIALARDELALAEQTEAAWMIGRGERLLGEALGPDGDPHLRRAVELLEPTTAHGELRKARAALARLGER